MDENNPNTYALGDKEKSATEYQKANHFCTKGTINKVECWNTDIDAPITHQERYTSVHDRKASFVLTLITSQRPVQTTKSDITVSAVSFFFLIF